jgi:uncharacterized protein YabE (DUF348 family)
LAFRDAVGGHPGQPGSEETHRPAATTNASSRSHTSAGSRASPAVPIQRLAARRRYRSQAAGLIAIAAIVLVLVALPARELRIIVDGDVATVTSRTSRDEAAVEQAGVELAPGDAVEETAAGDLVVNRATEAVLRVDGEAFTMRTQTGSVGDALAEASVALEPGDSVLRNDEAVSAEEPVAAPESDAPVELEVRRAVPFTLIENEQELQLTSSGSTVAAALRDVGVRTGPGDSVQPSLDTPLSAGLQVRVEHAQRLVVTLPAGKAVLYTHAGSVGEAVETSGIDLPADYRLEPTDATPIKAGLAVHVVGISSELSLETERVQSYTVYEADPGLPPGTERVVEGQDGVLYREYALVYQDGALVSRDLTAEWYDPEPVDTVVYYSTAEPAPDPEPVIEPDEPAYAVSPPASSGDWRDIVCTYGWDCGWAMAVIMCESGGNPNAYNPAGPYIGLFQIYGGHGSNLQDPATNIAAAYSLYLSGGRGNWPNCP